MTQSLGQLLMGGGGLNKTGAKDELCDTFKDAVDAWCKKPKDPSTVDREFADVYFSKLQEKHNNIALNVEREVPVLTKKVGKTDTLVGTLSEVAGGLVPGVKPEEVAFAQDIMTNSGYIPTMGSVDINNLDTDWAGSFRRDMNNQISSVATSRYGGRYPDGVFTETGQLLEIKGPGDKFDEGQAEIYQDESKRRSGKQVAVVSCESCPDAGCPENKKCR